MATTTTTSTAADADASGDPFAGGGGGGFDSECSTPFVSAPSSPTRDHHYHAHCFYSAPASPTRGGGGGGGGGAGCLDFDFDFSSRFPSPSAAAMSSADELFCNGQIRPVRLAAALLQPQQPAPQLLASDEADLAEGEEGAPSAAADERGRVRSRSVRRKARSMSPFRSHWRRSPSPAPVPTDQAPESGSAEEQSAATPAASRSSSSSSTTSSASSSSSSSRGSRRWGFIKDLLNRSKSDGGKSHPHSRHPVSARCPPPTERSPGATSTTQKSSASPFPSPSPSPAKGRSRAGPTSATGGRGRRRSAHERLYEARRAEAEEMRRRTYLPYRHGVLLFGCIGLGSRGYGAVHGLARGLNAAVSTRS